MKNCEDEMVKEEKVGEQLLEKIQEYEAMLLTKNEEMEIAKTNFLKERDEPARLQK